MERLPLRRIACTACIRFAAVTLLSAAIFAPSASAQSGPTTLDTLRNPEIQTLVARLDLEKYKATIKGSTQFGDRRQGTARNRAARRLDRGAVEELRLHEHRARDIHVYLTAAARWGCRSRRSRRWPCAAAPAAAAASDWGSGGARMRGVRTRTGVNTDSLKQTDLRLRALNCRAGERRGTSGSVLHQSRHARILKRCTSSAATWTATAGVRPRTTTDPGTALVMELARIFSSPDVQTDRSIRFALWNNEETGLNGARAYVDAARGAAGQGKSAGIRASIRNRSGSA